jgi:methylaspartate mutase S subunit
LPGNNRIVLGVIGSDVHAVGNKILEMSFRDAGFKVINLGVMVSQEEFIHAAIESDAGAILVSSLYGHGEMDCRGLREKCHEAGLSMSCSMSAATWLWGNAPLQRWISSSKRWALIVFTLPAPCLKQLLLS